MSLKPKLTLFAILAEAIDPIPLPGSALTDVACDKGLVFAISLLLRSNVVFGWVVVVLVVVVVADKAILLLLNILLCSAIIILATGTGTTVGNGEHIIGDDIGYMVL